MDLHTARGSGLRLSLLWKLLLPSALIFASIAGLMTWQSAAQLNDQLRQKTIEQLQGDQRVLISLFAQLRSEYAHMGTELATAYAGGGASDLKEYIERSPDIFARLNWVTAHGGDGTRLAAWAPAGLAPSLPPGRQLELLTRARQELRPVGRILCAQDCEYVLATPAGERRDEIYMILAAPVTEILPVYGALTGADIVLFRGRPGERAGLQLVAQTVSGLMGDAELAAVAVLPSDAAGERRFGARHYAYLLAGMGEVGGAGTSVRALLLRDLTRRHAQARRQAAEQLALDLLIMLIGGLALYWILSRNLERLRRVTEVLPMLSESGHYARTREALQQASPAGLAADEVDALRDTLDWLSVRLEQLHGAEAASEAKSRFLATMSHEIRTPMSGILGLTEILAQSELGRDQRRMAVMIHESTANLLSIINDVLDYSRIEAGAAELDLIEFNPAGLLESVADMVALNAASKNLRLRVLYPPDLPVAVRGDQGKIRQILLNLASNAIKFTEAGGVTLQLAVEWRIKDQATVVFSVCDTGIGIPREAQARVFQRFSQADSTTTRKFGGTGLGLAICDGLARLMGGMVELESDPGHGSTFSLSLELPVVAEAGQAEPALNGYRVELDVDVQEQACWQAHLRAAGAELGDCEVGRDGPCVQITNAGNDMTMLDCRRLHAGELETAVVQRPVKPSELAELVLTLSLDGAGEQAAAGQRSQFGLRVLVAEDQPVNRDLLGRQLAQLGCESVLAADGREALDALGEGAAFDLVITDLHMPGLDGYELTRHIRQHPREAIRSLPVVVLTASASPQDLSRLQRYGVDRKLVKPLRLSDLEHCLHELAPGRPPPAARPAGSAAVPAAESAPVLDRQLLQEVLGEDLSVLGGYRDMFEQTTRPLLDQCREALQAGDMETLQKLTHRVKGSSRSLGGIRLAEGLAALEQAIRDGEPGLARRLDRAQADFEDLVRALDALVQAA